MLKGREMGYEEDADERLRNDLLGPLNMHFLTASAAYRDYLEQGKTFLFACSLRRTNSSARRLLLHFGHLLPQEYRSDVLALLRHYDVWLTLWDDLAARTTPGPDDEFIFETRVPFPSEAQSRIMSLLARST
jgi:hypothetical protein